MGSPIRLRRHIGYVIQEIGLFPHFSVERNVGLVPSVEGWPPERIRERVRELLLLVGLDPQLAARYPRQLSGGMQQRVSIARAMVHQPQVVLADEPYSGLDESGARSLTALLGELRSSGTAVIIVTHNLAEGLSLATHAAVMQRGKFVRYEGRDGIDPTSYVATYREAVASSG